MMELFSRNELEKRGFSSGKKRRKVTETGFRRALNEGNLTRISICLAFAFATTAYVLLSRQKDALFAYHLTRSAVVVNVIIFTMLIHFYINLTSSFVRNGRLVLMLSVILCHLFLLKAAFLPAVNATFASPLKDYLFLFPAYALAPMMMSILLGRAHGTFVAIYVSLLGGLLVEQKDAFIFVVMSLVSGFVAVYFSHHVRRRSKVVRAGFYVGLATTVLAIALGQIEFSLNNWQDTVLQCTTTLLIGAFTAMLVSGIVPLIESLFGITTEITWIELADLNHPLLRRLTFEAPGTYHHSLVVARLAEAAADEIGANGTMCRVCSYFHDIGKLSKPQYFIENGSIEDNPHRDLTPTMSALIIISHVKDGVDLALKHGLNDEIISVIREHHGNTLVQFFHHLAMDQRRKVEEQVREGKAHQDDIPAVEEKSFRYPGPKPQSRESAIISLADGIESASRCLQKPTPQKIEQLIDEITKSRMRDGQLDECPLTLADLTRIKKSFYTTLLSMTHNRISYPKGATEDDEAPRLLEARREPVTVKEDAASEERPKAKSNAASA